MSVVSRVLSCLGFTEPQLHYDPTHCFYERFLPVSEEESTPKDSSSLAENHHICWMCQKHMKNYPSEGIKELKKQVTDAATRYLAREDLCDNDRVRAFLAAAQHGDIQTVKAQANKLWVWDNGMTALSLAATNGDLEMAQELFKQGFIFEEDSLEIPVWKAAEKGHFNMVKMLLKSQPNMNDQDRGIAVQQAVQKGYFDVAFLVLEEGEIDPFNRGLALESAIRYQHIEAVKKLLEGDISKSLQGAAFETAAAYGNLEIFNLLLSKYSFNDEDKNNVIWAASGSGCLKVIEKILEDFQISKESQEKAVLIAKNYQHHNIVSFFETKA